MFSNLSSLLDPTYLVETLIFILAFVLSISFHERSHAWAAWKLGDDTAYLAGRLTMNPMAHIDPIGLLMVVFAKIGWAKPVPINPVRFRGPMKRGIVLVSAAGPASNLLLAFLSGFLYVPMERWMPAGTLRDLLVYSDSSYGFLAAMVLLNVSLALFNLLPVPPLDGYKVLGAVLPDRIYYTVMRYERYIGLVFLVIVLFGGSYLAFLLAPVRSALTAVILFIPRALFGLIG